MEFYCIGFNIKLVKTQNLSENQWISREAHEKLSRKRTREVNMTKSWRVVPDRRFRKYLAGKAFPQDSRETFCLEDFYVWLPYPSLILYIPTLPTNVIETIQRGKP